MEVETEVWAALALLGVMAVVTAMVVARAMLRIALRTFSVLEREEANPFFTFGRKLILNSYAMKAQTQYRLE